MSDKHAVTFKATMTRDQWRTMNIRAETINPPHRSGLRWLSALSAETFDVAEVTVDTSSGRILAKPWTEPKVGTDRLTLDLSRDATLGLKVLAIKMILGTPGPRGEPAQPATLLERRNIFDALEGVADGKVLRLVKKEAQLPESDDLDEDVLDDEEAEESLDTPEVPKGEAKKASEEPGK